MDQSITSKLSQTRNYIRLRTHIEPKIGIILGSGLGSVIESSKEDFVFHFNELPHFAPSTVHGHNGELIIGGYSGKGIAIMQGRVHYYEGYAMEQIMYPVRLLKWLGIEYLIITAATGGLNPAYKKGDIVAVKDHINLMGDNPLRGVHTPEFGERFPDLSGVYSKDLRKTAAAAARKAKVKMKEGVYLAVSGPSYETPSEIKAFRRLGGDVVGMSVIPEAIAARQMGVKVLGLAYVSNVAVPARIKPLSHMDVVEAGKKTGQKLGKLIAEIINRIQ
ncbi:MAG: purine-nucleoside phosphorylase [Elusimicrobiota bacterium]